jgi:hypothetical protein
LAGSDDEVFLFWFVLFFCVENLKIEILTAKRLPFSPLASLIAGVFGLTVMTHCNNAKTSC